MDWFYALEGPTQVAIVSVGSAVAAAVSAAAVAAFNGARSGTSSTRSEVAMMAFDTTAVKQVAAALEALNMTLMAQNRQVEKGADEAMAGLSKLVREIEELRREVRALTDKMRG